jgi:hypothetical protein
MPGRGYSVPFVNLTLTNDADQDIFEIVNGSTSALILLGFELYSATTSDERLNLRLLRRSTTGSGGTGAVEVATDGGNTVAASAAVNQLVTTPGTAGAVLRGFFWSQLSPLIYLPTPEQQIIVSPGGRIALHLQTAVASSRNISGSLDWMEVG